MFLDVKTGKPISTIYTSVEKFYADMAMTADFVGGKAYGLHKMQQHLTAAVPMAFVLPTTLCGHHKLKTVQTRILAGIKDMHKKMVYELGYVPLVSVRSGAKVSCPGMMDTILNVGIDDTTKAFWSERLGEKAFADCYKRLITMYADVVMKQDRKQFDACPGYRQALVLYKELVGEDFPDATNQLLGAIDAVFGSWHNERAKTYREMNGIPHDLGTAVVIQQMVFGNLDDASCTGVLFTRNPDNGANNVVGEFLVNAQGEDVVAGIRTPEPLTKMIDWNNAILTELLDAATALEKAQGDMQDIEFTVEAGKLYLLQTRNGKRTHRAAVIIALDMYKEGAIGVQEVYKRLTPKMLDLAQVASIPAGAHKTKLVGTGIPACSGIAVGVVKKTAEAAINCKEPCILVSDETTPEDIAGMNAAAGVLTMKGGSTSHAAVVARGMNKVCVVGFGAELSNFTEGETITVCGQTGRVWKGAIPFTNTGAEVLTAFEALLAKEMPTAQWLEDMIDLTALIVAGDWASALEPVLAEAKKGKATALVRQPTTSESTLMGMFSLDIKVELEKVLKWVPKDLRGNISLISLGSVVLPKVEGYKVLPITDDFEEALGATTGLVWKGSTGLAAQRLLRILKEENIPLWSFGEYTPDAPCILSKQEMVQKLLSSP